MIDLKINLPEGIKFVSIEWREPEFSPACWSVLLRRVSSKYRPLGRGSSPDLDTAVAAALADTERVHKIFTAAESPPPAVDLDFDLDL